MRALVLGVALALFQAPAERSASEQHYDVPPRLLKQTRPEYPADAIRRKVEGRVVVEYVINTEGQVTQPRVIGSAPPFDAAAIKTVQQWRFAPAKKDGQAVSAVAQSLVVFCMTEQGCRLLNYKSKKKEK